MTDTRVSVDVEKLLRRLGIEAKKKGKEWYAVCPNKDHDDRDPSWRMRDEPGSSRHAFMKCWPCGFQGNAATLVMHLLKIESYGDAWDWIREGAEVEQKAVERVVVQVKRPRYGFQLPEGTTIEPIENWPSGAREYFLGRGLEEWQVDRWGIGYSVEGRLRGRIVIPYRNAAGKVQGYTARTFVDDEIRYFEPKPEEKANMNLMFGEQHWPPLGERDLLFVVEGSVNALALEAELPGVYVSASAGNSLRPLYGTKFATWTRLCVMTDPDEAGDALATEIAETASRHVKVDRLRLEEGTDVAAIRALRRGEVSTIVRRWLAR